RDRLLPGTSPSVILPRPSATGPPRARFDLPPPRGPCGSAQAPPAGRRSKPDRTRPSHHDEGALDEPAARRRVGPAETPPGGTRLRTFIARARGAGPGVRQRARPRAAGPRHPVPAPGDDDL